MRWLGFANLALLAVYPLAWWAPLARAGFMPWFEGDAITVIGGIGDLWGVDPVLAILVALFAMVLPLGKTAALAAIHFGLRGIGPRALHWVEAIGKFSMAEVFLLATYIVVVKGVGLGHVTPAWGLWLFTAAVLAQIVIGHLTARELARSSATCACTGPIGPARPQETPTREKDD